jgi:hypothetical protein
MFQIMKTPKYIIAAISLSMLTLTGCTDWLDQEPISNVTTSSYFKNASDFESAADNLAANNYGWASVFTSNEMLDLNFDSGSDLGISQKEWVSGTNGVGTSDTYYTKAYQRLRHVNNLLEQAQKYKDNGGTEDINNSVGTAYFYRAWWHFFLLKRFGGITLMLSVPNTTSDIVWGPRNSRYEVVSSILSDLDQAIQLLTATKANTSNDGHLTVEAAEAFKARVCLFEGTWEKYNGRGTEDTTNGDGTTSGAGTAMPSDYPSVNELLTMAKNEAAKFVSGGQYADEYSIWMGVEDNVSDYYKYRSNYYLFCLEESGSNPAGLDKTSNDEAIFRKCYDYSQKVYTGMNLDHSAPCSGTRKLMDMYLCSDGLPINKSPLFKGYHEWDSEFANRDKRMTSLFCIPGQKYWSIENYHADYSITPYESSNISYSMPNLRTYSVVGYTGRKYCSEMNKAEYQTAPDYLHIRLPEMLVTYAEATYELNGSISDTELNNTINLIRKRNHVADLTNALVNDNGLDMLQEIRRERALELYGEGWRVSDLCRWGIAEEELDRPTCSYYVSYDGVPTKFATEEDPNSDGLMIYDADAWNGYITTEEQVQSTYTAGMPTVKPGALITETQNNRIFSKKNYLQPIPQGQIDLNNQLLQNPQW